MCIRDRFSRHAYSVPAQQTPLVREKVERVVERFGFLPDSHSARDLMGIIEDYPRDELFHICLLYTSSCV